MRVLVLSLIALLLGGDVLLAQDTKAPATKTQTKQDAKAPAAQPQTKQDAKAPATKTQIKQDAKAPATQPQTKQDSKAPATKAPATKAPATKTGAAAPPAAPAAGTKAPGGAQGRPALTVAPETPPRVQVPVIMRESFDYDGGGRRDPFFSLLGTSELRPTVADLRLVGILYDESGRRPVAIMRDLQNNTQYRVTTGMTLGRMRVALIKRRAVIFSIEEFGLNRQDSLVLGDTSRARAR